MNNLNNLEEILNIINLQVLNDKIVSASILNLGAILKFHTWHIVLQQKVYKSKKKI
jgi:hypothetical protein